MANNNNNFLDIKNIKKTYGVVRALKGVTFSIKKGEVHTLLGENGAGKSTLVKIIKGEVEPDAGGQIFVDGKIVKEYKPTYAQKLGISMVHQELAVFENMSIAENIFPTMDFKTKYGTVDRKALYKAAQKSIDMFGMDIKPNQMMDTLTLAQQQMVEILRCISLGQRIILLDEPTSGLNNDEADKLMSIIKQLRQDEITIIYISHRINEIMEISDRVTVLRDGEYIITYDNDENLHENDLINKMVGREFSDSLYAKKSYDKELDDEILFEVKGMNKENAAYDIEFDLKKKEIIGFFGLEGSGTNAVSRMIYGLEGMDSGDIIFKGEKIDKVSPTEMVRRKISYLNNNRKHAGLLLNSGAMDNMSMPVLKQMSKFSFLNMKKLKGYTEKFIQSFSIVIPSIWTKPKTLSGGNQQKLMLSICLGTEPECLIINEPTRGIDVGAKAEIHEFILKIADEGLGVVVFSSELPELIGLADRIYVMNNKRIVGEITKGDITEESVMVIAAGSR